jgi:quercetin dioxygenase-like cupin family protein
VLSTNDPNGWFRFSDHYPLFVAGVPAVFLTDLGSNDYHRPSDDAEAIDGPKLARTTHFGLTLVRTLGDAEHRICGPARTPIGQEIFAPVPSGNGVQVVVVDGDLQGEGPFTMLVRLEPGAWIPPHFHGADKQILVLRGELLIGRGATLDTLRVHSLTAGTFLRMPAMVAHYEGARDTTVVAMYGIGPMRTTWLRPPQGDSP